MNHHHHYINQMTLFSSTKTTTTTTTALPLVASSIDQEEVGPQYDGSTNPQAQALMMMMDSSSSSTSANSLVRTVSPGDRVNIPCSLANAGGSIQFAKDDQPIILDSGCSQCQLDISNDGQASLTINRVSSKDQGHWQCWRLDSQGKVKQRIPIINLVVTNSPELPILVVNDKELLGGNNIDGTITVKENELVQFKCIIKGASSPVDYVHWMLDSSQNVTHLSQLMLEFSAQDNNYLTQSILRLNATKSMNLKSISCLSNHQLWLTPMTVTAFLNVLYEPSFTISREPGFGMTVSEGMAVRLKCEIDSNPASSPIWIKDADNKTAAAANNALMNQQQVTSNSKEASGDPILLDTQEDGSVIFQPAQRSDSGWYRCKTENKYGNFSSFGYYLNVRPASSSSSSSSSSQQHYSTISPQHRNNNNNFAASAAGQSGRVMMPNQAAARVSGASGAGASPTTQSSFSSSNIMNNDQPSVASPAAEPMPQFQHQHQHHVNQLMTGSGSGASQGIVQSGGCPKERPDGFPVIDHPVSVVNAVLGRQLVLPLRFCCNPGPARVFWIHRHLAMIPGRMFGPYITREIYPSMNSFYCYESTFEIESVKPEDIGTVYVFVNNDKGYAGAQIHIQLAKSHLVGSTNLAHEGGLSLGSRFHLSASSSSSAIWPKHAHKSYSVHWSYIWIIIASLLLVLQSHSIIKFQHHNHRPLHWQQQQQQRTH